ncbi:MAG: peroxiredoxin [Metamycoplasmataceae bacterium]
MKTIFKEKERNLLGTELNIGDVLKFKAVDTAFNICNFESLKDITIFSIFPSINTKICDIQTSRMNKIAQKHNKYDFVAISLDLPTALNDWCGAHNINNIKAVSDYQNREFGMKTGFLIDEIFLLNRGIIILDKNNKVIYISRNTNVHDQINFGELEDFLENL